MVDDRILGRFSNRPPAAIDADIRLTLRAWPENVAIVRHVVGAVGDALDLPPATVQDMRLAVTEACSNVVRHAYVQGEGWIELAVKPHGDALEVVVSDSGRGIEPSPDTAGPGLGLPLIAALADSFDIEHQGDGGSRLVMSFLRSRPTRAMGPA